MKALLLIMIMALSVNASTEKQTALDEVETCVTTLLYDDDVSSQWAFEECQQAIENGDKVKYSDLREETVRE